MRHKVGMLRKIWRSKTIRFGFFVALLGGVQVYLPDYKEMLDPTIYGICTSIIGITIIMLRFLTTVPLDEK